MHEFSIAVDIVGLAEKNARQAGAKKINRIDIEIGTLSGVVHDALHFAMESAAKGTMLENAEVIITDIPAMAECAECHKHFTIDSYADACPRCGAFQFAIISGKQLQVKSIEVEDG